MELNELAFFAGKEAFHTQFFSEEQKMKNILEINGMPIFMAWSFVP